MVSDTDWFGVLKWTLQSEGPIETMRPDDVEALIVNIVSGRIKAPARDRRHNRHTRRKLWAAGVVVAVLGSGATVAAVWNRSADKPHEGIACHVSADLGVTRAVVIPPAADPIAACSNVWGSGAVPAGHSTEVVPNMFVCAGASGGLEVFPVLSDAAISCEDLGLSKAIGVLTVDPLVALQDRLSADINANCTDVETARKLAQSALTDLGLTNWTITVRREISSCTAAGEDVDTQSVYLFSVPTTPPNS